MGHLTEFVVVPMYYTHLLLAGAAVRSYTGIGIVNVCTTIAKCCARIAHILLGHSRVSNKLLKPGIIGFMSPLYFSSLDFDSLFSLSDFLIRY